MTYQEILDYKYHFKDADVHNLREYFHKLLFTLWAEGDGFSGKRPFGNSCWEYEIYNALVEMGAVSGEFDFYEGENCGLKTFDKEVADKLTFRLIKEFICQGSGA